MTNYIDSMLNNIGRNYTRGFITEKQRDEAIDEVLRSQEGSCYDPNETRDINGRTIG